MYAYQTDILRDYLTKATETFGSYLSYMFVIC